VIRIAIGVGILLAILTLIGGQYGKTLWDSMQLLLTASVPLAIAFIGTRYTQQRAQDDALEAYLNAVTELLTDDNRPLHRAQVGDRLSVVARARTLTTLTRLDGNRKGSVVQFLYESGLVIRERLVLPLVGADLTRVDLSGANLNRADLRWTKLNQANLRFADMNEASLLAANLSGANLSGAYLSKAELSGANLNKADLNRANLSRADLRWTRLNEANLDRANLSEANLGGAQVTKEQLTGCYLEGAIMPDGSKHR
jgi:uncharacterized protein YjbI with pentapeptide repeats